MATRALSILALAALAVMGSSVCALAESKADAMRKSLPGETKPETPPVLVNPNTRPELTTPNPRAELRLTCRPQPGSTQMVCSETAAAPAAPPTAPRLVHPDALFGTSFSLHTANNLSTTESTIKFLRGVTGNTSLAQKVTPTLMRISKAPTTRVGLAVAVLGTGALAVYERWAADDATKPAEGGGTYVLVGQIDKNGVFKETAAKKP